MSSAEETVWTQTVLRTSMHGDEMLALEVITPINYLYVAIVKICIAGEIQLTNIMTHL